MPHNKLTAANAIALSQAANWLAVEGEFSGIYFSGATQDSRKVKAGQLFVALPGEHVDGHDYVAKAAEAGAAAALVSRAVAADIPQLVVADVEQALQALATQWRASLDVSVAAVTGSCGKTTVKQMLAAILSEQAPVLATEGNLNNHLGVPLTLLSLTPEHRFAVIEMGANAKGDIALLCPMAQPNVALITMVGPAHLQGFGSLQGVAEAKGEIYQGLSDDGIAVFNADEPWLPSWQALAAGKLQLSFGSQALADVSVSKKHQQSWLEGDVAGSVFTLNLPDGSATVRLPLPGWHNVMNACAAAAVAVALGVKTKTIVAGLEKVSNVSGRLQLHRLSSGALLVDDSYNANPASVKAAAQWLSELSTQGARHLVLGEMSEMGPSAMHLHEQLGKALRDFELDQLWVCGAENAMALAGGFVHANGFSTQQDLVAALSRELGENDVVLVKGSRSSAMDNVVAALQTTVLSQTQKTGEQHHAG